MSIRRRTRFSLRARTGIVASSMLGAYAGAAAGASVSAAWLTGTLGAVVGLGVVSLAEWLYSNGA